MLIETNNNILMNIILLLSLFAIIFILYIEPKLSIKKIKNKNEHGSSKFADIKEIDKTTAWAMVPSCIYRGGCPEKGLGVKCDFYKKFLERHPEITVSSSLNERYDAYYEDFFGEKF